MDTKEANGLETTRPSYADVARHMQKQAGWLRDSWNTAKAYGQALVDPETWDHTGHVLRLAGKGALATPSGIASFVARLPGTAFAAVDASLGPERGVGAESSWLNDFRYSRDKINNSKWNPFGRAANWIDEKTDNTLNKLPGMQQSAAWGEQNPASAYLASTGGSFLGASGMSSGINALSKINATAGNILGNVPGSLSNAAANVVALSKHPEVAAVGDALNKISPILDAAVGYPR